MGFLFFSIFYNFKVPDSGVSDASLVRKYGDSGDLKVLGILYNRYMHLVYGVCMKYLQDREDSKDAVMQIFEKLVVEVPNHEIRNFKSWLHVLTRNFCLMQLRTRQTVSKHIRAYADEEEIFMESDPLLHPDNEQPWDGDLEMLRECIGELKEHQRDCVILFYLEDKPYKEIVDLLDIDLKKVKSYIQNARRNLKTCMEKKHEGGK
jgi:RNA polymerase sigma-70 factor (ECF subfamily)